jgi:hypothetical protein
MRGKLPILLVTAFGCGGKIESQGVPAIVESDGGGADVSAVSAIDASSDATASSTVDATGDTSSAVAVLFAAGAISPGPIAVDSVKVYFGASSTNPAQLGVPTGVLEQVPIAGGAPIILAQSMPFPADPDSGLLGAAHVSPVAIAIDSSNVYWTESQDTIPGRGTVKRVPIGGGAVTTMASSASPGPIALDANYVYWGTSLAINAGAILRVPVAGGPAATLVAAGSACALAVDAMNVYWAEFDGNTSTIKKVAKNGTTPITLPTNQPFPCALAVDASNVYWEGNDDSTVPPQAAIFALPLAGGTPHVVVSLARPARAFVLDPTGFYGTFDFDLWHAPRAGGAAIGLGLNVFINVAPISGGLAVDSTSVYWTANCWALSDAGTCNGAVLKYTPK